MYITIMDKNMYITLCRMSIESYVHNNYNIIKIKVRQTNSTKSCEAGNHIPVSEVVDEVQ